MNPNEEQQRAIRQLVYNGHSDELLSAAILEGRIEIMKPEDVTDDQLDRIENEVSMGAGAWDCINPKEIIAAAVSIVNADNLKSLLESDGANDSASERKPQEEIAPDTVMITVSLTARDLLGKGYSPEQLEHLQTRIYEVSDAALEGAAEAAGEALHEEVEQDEEEE